MRALFLEFPDEAPAWEVADEYMFGPDVLVAPIAVQGARERDVYLPEGASWLDAWTGEPMKKNGWLTVPAPLDRIPVFLRQGGALRTLSSGEGSQERGRPDIDVLAREGPTWLGPT